MPSLPSRRLRPESPDDSGRTSSFVDPCLPCTASTFGTNVLAISQRCGGIFFGRSVCRVAGTLAPFPYKGPQNLLMRCALMQQVEGDLLPPQADAMVLSAARRTSIASASRPCSLFAPPQGRRIGAEHICTTKQGKAGSARATGPCPEVRPLGVGRLHVEGATGGRHTSLRLVWTGGGYRRTVWGLHFGSWPLATPQRRTDDGPSVPGRTVTV